MKTSLPTRLAQIEKAAADALEGYRCFANAVAGGIYDQSFCKLIEQWSYHINLMEHALISRAMIDAHETTRRLQKSIARRFGNN